MVYVKVAVVSEIFLLEKFSFICLHCTDESHKLETNLSAVIYFSLIFSRRNFLYLQ